MTLRKEMPSADSCGDHFLDKQIEDFLPVGCGAEAVFNFSWEKEIVTLGSGDDDDDGDDNDKKWPVTTIGTTVVPARSLLSTPAHGHITSVAPNRSVTRLPPRFTPHPESRQSSFQHLLRIHLNTFNQRLSMLESNILDMKDSIHIMENQQGNLNTQLKELIAIQSIPAKNVKVNALEESYQDMETRLSRLEGRLEILIDGFTALAQEMNKMKRTRHISRSAQERVAPPPLTTVLALPMYTTPQPPVSKATVPKSIPTPGLPKKKLTTAPQRNRKHKPAATTKPVKKTTKVQVVTRTSKSKGSRSATKVRATSKKPRTTSKTKPKATVKPGTKRTVTKKPAVTAKRVSQPGQTKPKQVKDEATVTKFQLEPPARTKQVRKQSDQANKKDSARPVKNNGRNTPFRSDAPVSKKVQDGKKSSDGDSKKSQKGKSNHNSHKLVSSSHKTKKSAKDTITTTTKATTTKKKSNTTKKKSNTTSSQKRTSSPAKTLASTAKKVTKKAQPKTTSHNSGVLDLLNLLRGDKSAKQKKNQDGSLHVVLGRLAIPIRIIPDY